MSVCPECGNAYQFESIEVTKNFRKLKISVTGVCSRLQSKRGALSNTDKFLLGEISRLYQLGREAWMSGDLETVGEMFGVLAAE